MTNIENHPKILEEKEKIQKLKENIQKGLERIQKYEAELQKRHKLENKNADNKKCPKISENSKCKKTKFECDLCEKLFSSRDDFIVHKQTHTKKKPSENLKTHTEENPIKSENFPSTVPQLLQLNTDDTGETFKCKICAYACPTPSMLKVHIRKHTEETPFQCNNCSVTFSQLGNLKAHMKTHTGEKPFQCNTCQAKFAQLGNLKTHMRIHTGEKPFECNDCPAKFSDLSALKHHMKTHNHEAWLGRNR